MLNPLSADAIHTSAADVSAYLDRALPEGDRKRVEAHLADCSECRHEVVECARLMRTHAARPRRVRWALAAGMAATLAIIVGRVPVRPGTELDQAPGAVERGAESEDGRKLFAWGPTGGASIRRDALVLAWAPNSDRGTQYRVTLADSEGSTLWTASTPDTMLIPPPSLTLPGGRTYYWYTDALLPDGRSLTTGVQEFRMAP